LSEVIPEV